jgi:nucleolar protein 12
MASDNPFAKLLTSFSLPKAKPDFVEVHLQKRTKNPKSEPPQDDFDKYKFEDEAATSIEFKRPRKRKLAQEDPKADRTVFVGNLSVETTKKKLKPFFSDCGAVESIRFRSVVSRRAPNTKRPLLSEASRFNAYVVFKDPSSIDAALEKNGALFGGQKVRVDSVAKRKSEVEYPHHRSVFIGNVPHEVKEDSIYEAFSDCGEVEGVRLVRDRATGLCKGFGFVLFKDSSSVVLAMKCRGIEVDGRQLRVLPSRPEGAHQTKRRLGSSNSHGRKFQGQVAQLGGKHKNFTSKHKKFTSKDKKFTSKDKKFTSKDKSASSRNRKFNKKMAAFNPGKKRKTTRT